MSNLGNPSNFGRRCGPGRNMNTGRGTYVRGLDGNQGLSGTQASGGTPSYGGALAGQGTGRGGSGGQRDGKIQGQGGNFVPGAVGRYGANNPPQPNQGGAVSYISNPFRIFPIAEVYSAGKLHRTFSVCDENPGNTVTKNLSLSMAFNEQIINIVENGIPLYVSIGGLQEFSYTMQISKLGSSSAAVGGINKQAQAYYFIDSNSKMQAILTPNSSTWLDVYQGGNIICHVYKDQFAFSIKFSPVFSLSKDQVALLIFLVMKYAVFYSKYEIFVSVPACIFRSIPAKTAAIPHTTTEMLQHILSSMSSVKLCLNSYETEKLCVTQLLDTNGLIIFTFELLTTTGNDGGTWKSLSVKDNYGKRLFSAVGFDTKSNLIVQEEPIQAVNVGSTQFSSPSQNILGKIEGYPTDFAVPNRTPTQIYDSSDAAIMRVQYRFPGKPTAVIDKHHSSVSCSIFRADDADCKVADIMCCLDRVHIDIVPESTIENSWKILIVVYAMKMVHNYYELKYAGKMCTFPFGYLQ